MRSSRSTTGIFRTQEKSRKSISIKIDVCNVCDASCTVERIETHSNHSTSMEIKWQLQLAACAAPGRPQEFFVRRKNQEKSISIKIDVCNVCDASCTVERIKTQSNHSTSMKIKWQLQLAARAAPGRTQEFFVRRKNQEKSISIKFDVCDASCTVERIKTHSNHSTSMEIKWQLQLAACAAPADHRNFSHAGKIDFDQN